MADHSRSPLLAAGTTRDSSQWASSQATSTTARTSSADGLWTWTLTCDDGARGRTAGTVALPDGGKFFLLESLIVKQQTFWDPDTMYRDEIATQSMDFMCDACCLKTQALWVTLSSRLRELRERGRRRKECFVECETESKKEVSRFQLRVLQCLLLLAPRARKFFIHALRNFAATLSSNSSTNLFHFFTSNLSTKKHFSSLNRTSLARQTR